MNWGFRTPLAASRSESARRRLMALIFAACAVVGIANAGNVLGATVTISDAPTIVETTTGTTTALFPVTVEVDLIPAPVSVTFTTLNGTASAADDDFVSVASGSITIPEGDISAVIPITVNGDTKFEDDETFSVRLVGSPSGDTIGVPDTGSVTVSNDDASPTINLVDPGATLEGDTGDVIATFTVQLTNASAFPVSVQYAMTDGTATSPEDFTAVSGTASFAPGTISQSVNVTVHGDALDEADSDTAGFSLSSGVGGSIGDGVGTLAITDDDATPSLSIAAVAIGEGDSGSQPATVTVSLSAVSGRNVTFNFATGAGSATPVADYVATNGSRTILAGASSATFPVAVNGDLVDEVNETIPLNLSATVNAAIGAPPQGTITITDNDTSVVSSSNPSVTEGTGGATNLTFTVSVAPVNDRDITIAYTTANLEAAGPGDYTPTVDPGFVVPALQGSRTITVPITADNVDELNETFRLDLLSADAAGSSLAVTGGVGTINDDDTSSISIDDVAQTEGNSGNAPAPFTVTLSTPSDRTVTVTATFADGTARSVGTILDPADYVATDGTVTFAPGETSQPLPTSIVGDLRDEGNEQASVTLTAPTSGATLVDNAGLLTILDDDPTPTLSIVGNPSATEGNTATFNVNLSTPSGRIVTVNYSLGGGNATNGVDYTHTPVPLTFAPGETTKPIAIATVDDTSVEGPENFGVTLATPTNATVAGGTGIGTIVDNDLPSLTINDQTVLEGAAATFTVTLSPAFDQTVTVDYVVNNGTATQPADFTIGAPTGTLTFGSGVTTRTIVVAAVADNLDEPGANETFTVDLANPSAAVVVDPSGAGSITDNDATPSVSIASGPANEGNPGPAFTNPVATLTRSSSVPLTVGYAVAPGTATSPSDFTGALSGTLTFGPGATTAPIPVDVVADTTFEPTESFAVSLSGPSANLLLGTASATYTVNNDDPQPTISVADASLPEAGPGAFTVSLSNPSYQTITVNYAVTPGTATSPADYTATAAGTLTFTPGTVTQTIPIAVFDDLLDEDPETLTVALSVPVATTIADGAAIGTIVDNDLANQPTLSFTLQSTETQREGNAGATIKNIAIQLSNVSGRNVSVTWQTLEVPDFAPNAQPNVDYGAVNPITVVFTPGQTAKTLPISVIGDTNGAEGSESIGIQLSAPVNTSIVGIATKQLLIIEDDVANQPPFATADTATVPRSGTASINVRANDFDPNNDALFVPDNSNPAHGTAICRNTGICIYTPTPGYSGPDSFNYTLSDGQATTPGTVTITVVNATPVANPDTLVTGQGAPGSVNVLANDSDPDSAGPLTITSAGTATNGTVACGAGVCNYVPRASYVGADQFTYTIRDPDGATAVGTVNVTVAKGTPLTMATKADKARSKVGTRNGYTVTIRNPNGGTVTATSVSVCLPKGFGYVARSVTGPFARVPVRGSCGSGRTKLTWTKRVGIAGKGAVSLKFKVTVGGPPTTARITATARAADGFAVTPLAPAAPIKVSR